MERIEMNQMVRPSERVNAGKASANNSDVKTDFAQMLKGKEQTVQEEKTNPKSEKKDDGQETEGVKKEQKQENEPHLPEKEGEAQVPAEVMIQLQAALNQLMENHGQVSELADTENTDAEPGIKQDNAVSAAGTVPAADMTTVMAETGTAEDAAQLIDESLIPMAAKEEAVQTLPVSEEAAGIETPGKDTPVKETAVQEEAAGNHNTQPNTEQPAVKGPEQSLNRDNPKQDGPEHQSGKDGGGKARENAEYTFSAQDAGSRTQFIETPVKGQTDTAAVRTTPDTFPADVGKAIAARMPKADNTLTIELEPAALGKLTIKVVYEAGRAAVSIMSANPKTLELLSQSAGDIAQILEDKTGQQTVVYTPDPEQDLDGRQGGQNSGRQDQQRDEDKRQSQPDSFAQQLRLGLV